MQGQGKEQERLRRHPHHPVKRRQRPAQEEVREAGALWGELTGTPKLGEGQSGAKDAPVGMGSSLPHGREPAMEVLQGAPD